MTRVALESKVVHDEDFIAYLEQHEIEEHLGMEPMIVQDQARIALERARKFWIEHVNVSDCKISADDDGLIDVYVGGPVAGPPTLYLRLTFDYKGNVFVFVDPTTEDINGHVNNKRTLESILKHIEAWRIARDNRS